MNPLRNANINYFNGWFFVTFQVAMNKTVFGVIDGKKLIHNALGRMVSENLCRLGEIFKEIYVDACVVMPNHVHAVIRITPSPPSPQRARGHDIIGARGHDIIGAQRARGHEIIEGKDLTYFIGRFKSFTTNQYHKMVKAGECVDIGTRLWNDNFYDNLISSHRELEAVRNYTRRNPERWEEDRFGAVTSYAVGNAELLNEPMVAFVASDTRDDWSKEKPHLREWRELAVSRDAQRIVRGTPRCVPLISTFTSFEERGALERRLEKRRPFVWVAPGGIREPLPSRVATACAEGWGLAISPVPSGTGVNKQRAIWCNRYVLRVAERIFVGTITPGGTLDSLLPQGVRKGQRAAPVGGV